MKSYPILVAAAQLERDGRIRHYPAQIKANTITRDDADADIRAWTAIAQLMEHGRTTTDCTWGQLALATTRALIRREEACKTAPDDAAKAARRDMVDAIDARIRAQRDAIADLNARLRAQAGRVDAQEAA